MALRLLTLDATGTIYKFRRSPIDDYVSVASNYGFKLDEARVKKQFKVVMKKMEAEHPHFGAKSQMDSMKWWITVCTETLKGSHDSTVDAKAFMPAAFHIYKHYSTAAAYSVYPDFVHFVRRLRTERPEVRTIVISNSDKRISNVLLQLGLLPFIDDVIFSELVSSSKPSPEIFNSAVRKSNLENLKPSQILHIGDDLLNDYMAPKSLGWNSLLLNRANVSLDTLENVHTEDICQDFSEVEAVLKARF